MQYRTLGRTGERVSELGFGGTGVGMKNYLSTWDPEQQEQEGLTAMTRAIELGVNYFDTAPLYGRGVSEQLFGAALKPHREQVFLENAARSILQALVPAQRTSYRCATEASAYSLAISTQRRKRSANIKH